MKKMYTIILIFLTQLVISQTTNDLDIKNGFRNFKLGSSPIQNKNIVKINSEVASTHGTIVYKYIGNDLISIFNIKVESIELSFFKNKLFSIRVSFGNIEKSFDLNEFNEIKGILEETYGTKWYTPSNDNGSIINGSIWDGKNVRLELFRFDYSKHKTKPKEYDFYSGYIHVYDKKLMQEMYNSNF